MNINKSDLAPTKVRRIAFPAVVVAITALMAACSSQPTHTPSPNLPAPRPVVATPAPVVQSPPVIAAPTTQTPAASRPNPSTPAAPAPAGTAATMSLDTGLYRCELGVRVMVKKIAPDKSSIVLNWKNKDYTLQSVGTQSGAIRYEDKAQGLVWMAIVGKSQLLDSKLGQRLANDCNL
jgi:Membrane-bound lysozyme-inhibitor of c-type lysozyme